MTGHDESVRTINRVMSVCFFPVSLKLSDFLSRIKALHFHQICMSPEGNTADIGIICHIVRGIVIIFTQRRVKKQVQHYNKYLKNSSFGVEKFNFSLGLLLIFNCTEWMYSSVSPLKSVPLGIYCRMSLFVFSIAPFCQDE